MSIVVFWLLKINLEMERISGQKSQEAIEKWTELIPKIYKLAAEENNYKINTLFKSDHLLSGK